MVSPYVPAHDVFGSRGLEGAPVGPGAVGQGQVRAVGRPHLDGPGGLGLVQQPVGGATQPVRDVGRARGIDLGLQRMQAPAAPGRAQALPIHGAHGLAPRNLPPTSTIPALMGLKGLAQGRFPSRCLLVHHSLRSRLPRIIPTGWHPAHGAEPPHRVVAAPGGDEAVAAHWSGVCEITRLKHLLTTAFFKSSCACRRARARSWRSSATVAGSSAAPTAAAWIEQLCSVRRRLQCGKPHRTCGAGRAWAFLS